MSTLTLNLPVTGASTLPDVVPPPPPPPWSPDLLPNLRGRWSAKSVNQSIGSSIASVPSSGGLSNTLSQAAIGSQPLLALVNGDTDLPAFDFDGEDDYLSYSDKTITKNASILTVAFLFKFDEIDTDAAPKSLISIGANSGGGTRFYFALEPVAGAVKRYGISGRATDETGTVSYFASSAVGDTDMHIAICTLNRATNPSNLSIWLDGEVIMNMSPAGLPTGAWNDSEDKGPNIGMRVAGAPKQSIDGKILDHVVIAGVLSTENRQRLEGCWAHDGKIPGKLPNGHPWKAQRPYLD